MWLPDLGLGIPTTNGHGGDPTRARGAHTTPPPNKSLLRSGGRWYLVCKSLAVIDKVPMISLGEPPGAELSR
jgi:hypothetical protein